LAGFDARKILSRDLPPTRARMFFVNKILVFKVTMNRQNLEGPGYALPEGRLNNSFNPDRFFSNVFEPCQGLMKNVLLVYEPPRSIANKEIIGIKHSDPGGIKRL